MFTKVQINLIGILTHPVMKAFITKKWEKVLPFYVLHFISFILLVLTFSCYLYYMFNVFKPITSAQAYVQGEVHCLITWLSLYVSFKIFTYSTHNELCESKNWETLIGSKIPAYYLINKKQSILVSFGIFTRYSGQFRSLNFFSLNTSFEHWMSMQTKTCYHAFSKFGIF